ncbi:MAG: BolA/IbaG family iron-sulfur metabolism protein [Steroidobacteraceae bacterium]|jgi:acid stress-induced BolA-like protein IbaG/YrbA
MQSTEIAELIRAALPGARVDVATEDNVHFATRVIAAEFAGKRVIARHQMIYAALGARMGNEIHALSIDALTPDEAAARSPGQPRNG